MSNSGKFIQYFDTLRALATLGVIIIHISSPLVNMTYGKNMPYWWVGNVVDSAVRFAVPLFLMLSGATMLGKECKLNDFYKKRFTRVFIPFVFWLLAYWVYRWFMLKPAVQPTDFQSILKWAADLFLKEGVSKHLWYVYMIVFIYLALPFLGKLLRNMRQSTLATLVFCWMFFVFQTRQFPLNLYSWSGDYGSKFLGYFLHTGYLMLGFYLSRIDFSFKKIRFVAGMVFILSVLVSALGTYFMSESNHHLNLTMYSYLNLNTMLQSEAIFVWIKDIQIKNKSALWIQSTLSNYSFGICLVHIMIIGILFRNGIYWSFSHPAISLPVLTLVVLLCSFAIIFLLRKVPGGKYIAG